MKATKAIPIPKPILNGFGSKDISILVVGSGNPYSEGFLQQPASRSLPILAPLSIIFHTFGIHFRTIRSGFILFILAPFWMPFMVPENDFNVILFAKIEKSHVVICATVLINFGFSLLVVPHTLFGQSLLAGLLGK